MRILLHPIHVVRVIAINACRASLCGSQRKTSMDPFNEGDQSNSNLEIQRHSKLKQGLDSLGGAQLL